MDTKTRIWIKSMELGSKYWGCHQIPERSFFIKGWQMPICARCFGMICGEGARLFFGKTKTHPCFGIIIMLPLVIDGSVQFASSYESTNTKRFITGVMFGYGFLSTIIALLSAIIGRLKKDDFPPPTITEGSKNTTKQLRILGVVKKVIKEI